MWCWSAVTVGARHLHSSLHRIDREHQNVFCSAGGSPGHQMSGMIETIDTICFEQHISKRQKNALEGSRRLNKRRKHLTYISLSISEISELELRAREYSRKTYNMRPTKTKKLTFSLLQMGYDDGSIADLIHRCLNGMQV